MPSKSADDFTSLKKSGFELLESSLSLNSPAYDYNFDWQNYAKDGWLASKISSSQSDRRLSNDPQEEQRILDENLLALIHEVIDSNNQLRKGVYAVKVRHGIVTIRGQVLSLADKALIEELIEALPEVQDLNNELQVKMIEHRQKQRHGQLPLSFKASN